jgi:hypothetical protein
VFGNGNATRKDAAGCANLAIQDIPGAHAGSLMKGPVV